MVSCDEAFILCHSVVKPIFMSPRPKRTKHWRLEWRKVCCRNPARRMQWSCSKDPNSLMGVREAFFKARWGKWGHKVGDQLVCESLIGWWWGKRAVSQGLALSIVRRQWVWGICAQGHLVVNFFHLVGSFSICKTTQEMYIRFCYLAYFRDELKILWLPCGWFTVSFLTGSYGSTVIFVWREGSVLGMPLRFYSVTILYIYIYIWKY